MGVVRFRRHGMPVVVAVFLAAGVLPLLPAAARAYAPGELLWAHGIGTSTSQAGVRGMAAGPGDVVAVAGWQGLALDERAPMVAKYGPDGLEWTRTYEGRGEAQAVAFDRAGNVYVAASVASADSDYDIVVLKYDGDGARQWAATWGGDGTGYALARHVAVDRSGDIVVVGTEDVIDDAGRFVVSAVVVLKYHADGTLAWPAAALYEPAAGDATIRTVELSDAALDAAGDVYVSGTLFSAWYRVRSDMEGLVLKFAGTDGALVASRTDECPPGTESQFSSIAVRGSRVAVAGMALDMTEDGAVIDAHGLVAGFDLGLQEERRRVWDPDDTRYEVFGDVELDARGDAYVTGSQAWLGAAGLPSQAVTLKFDASLGTVLWQGTYAPERADADTYLLAREANGDVYVAGVRRTGTPAEYSTRDCQDFLVIKYGRRGEREWVRTWSGGGPGFEGPRGLALGTKRDVFVGGQACTADGVLQAAMLRYQR